MQHIRHRFDLLAKITKDEQQRDELNEDGTVDRSVIDEIEARLDQTRAELATYSSTHAEAIVAEEVAMVEATNDGAAGRREHLDGWLHAGSDELRCDNGGWAEQN